MVDGVSDDDSKAQKAGFPAWFHPAGGEGYFQSTRSPGSSRQTQWKLRSFQSVIRGICGGLKTYHTKDKGRTDAESTVQKKEIQIKGRSNRREATQIKGRSNRREATISSR